MLLEIENQLHKKIHEALGQSAVVLRLAESLDESGRVAEQSMIIVSFTSDNTSNPNKEHLYYSSHRKITYTLHTCPETGTTRRAFVLFTYTGCIRQML
jgi:hypothetical protein